MAGRRFSGIHCIRRGRNPCGVCATGCDLLGRRLYPGSIRGVSAIVTTTDTST